MKYMLDTNVIIYLKENLNDAVKKKFASVSKEDICISSITYAELEYGICHSTKREQNRLAIMLILAGISILPFNDAAAVHYGMIRDYLVKNGIQVGANDMLIAAHARANNLCLVTHNSKEFERIPDLSVEDWFV